MATRSRRREALIEAAALFGLKLEYREIDQHWGRPFAELVAGIAPGVDYEAFHRQYAQVMERHPPRALPGARALLACLREAGRPRIVVTSGSRTLVYQDLRLRNMADAVDVLFGFEDTRFHKPDPRVLRPAIEWLAQRRIHPQDAIYVGDSVLDHKVAAANRFEFHGVLTGISRREEFVDAGVSEDHIVPSLTALVERIEPRLKVIS